MPDNLNAKGEIGLDVAKAVSALNKLIDGLVAVKDKAPQAASQLDKLEKSAVGIATALSSGTTSIKTQNTALKQNQDAAYSTYRSNIAFSKSQESITRNLASTRYALYDVATTYGTVSAATLGAATAATALAISYEKSFASVERTSGATGSTLDALNSKLINISTTLPVAFSDVTSIATLGAQLGVATANLDEFTTTVAQFSATTNVSTDAAATGLGRLVQLTNKSTGSYEQYASAIYQVGINSVATEAQVLAVAQQIATSGNLAGFSADQIIGLAGALASLGVAPEAARGSILRIFNEITTAAKTGGDSLNQFASISGMTADQFSKAWASDPQQVFSAFVSGLGSAADKGGNLVGILSSLGVNAVRDQRALQLLADNTDVYNQALSDSSSAYADGSALGDGYAVTAGTIAAKLQVLVQTLQAVIAEAGASTFEFLRPGIEILQGLAEAALKFANTPVGKAVSVIVLGLATLIGVFFAARAAISLTQASILGLVQVQRQLAQESGIVDTRIRALIPTMLGLSGSANGAATSLRTAAASAKAFASSTLIGVGITVGLAAVTAAVNDISYAFSSAGDKAKSYYGDLSGLSDALKQDTATYKQTGDAVRTISTEVKSSSDALAPWAVDLEKASGSQVTLTDATTQTTTSVEDQTVAIGDNAKAWLANAVANDAAFQKFYKNNKDALQQAGFNLQEFLSASLTSDTGASDYLQGLIDNVDKVRMAQTAAIPTTSLYNDEVLKIESAANQARGTLDGLTKIAEANDGAFSSAASQAEITKEVYAALGVTADGTADDLGTVTDSLNDLIDSAYASTGSTVAVQNAISSLGQSLAEHGNDFSAYSINGRENLGALQSVISAMATASGGDAAVLATNIAGLMQSLGAYGVSAAGDLQYLQAILNSLTNGKGTGSLPGVTAASNAASNALGQGFSVGASKAAKSASKTAKEVKTLTDYVSDLGSVFKSAFEIRFGYDQSLDKVSESYKKLSDYSDDAAASVQDALQSIMEADAKIRGLQASNQTLEYQLKVAQEYGDVLRANEILAQMAENNADLSSAQQDRTKTEKDLKKAQDASSKSLTGDTEASREQRDMVLDLISSYQDQVQALANTGLTQSELARQTAILRQQFVSQLTQMGYNRTEVDKYALAFDDLTAAIARVPRNITVSANTDPAQRAIDEFLAKNANRSVGVSANLSGTGGNLGNFTAGIIGANALNTNTVNSREWINSLYKTAPDRGPVLFPSKGGEVPSYLASGGQPGHPGGPRGTDTIPAWLTPGEVVQRKAAVDYYGLPFMNALNNMQVPKYLATGGPARASSGTGNSGIQLVEILPNQIQQIAAAVSTIIELDSKVLAKSVGGVNTGNARRGSN